MTKQEFDKGYDEIMVKMKSTIDELGQLDTLQPDYQQKVAALLERQRKYADALEQWVKHLPTVTV